jgi:hypothetical protein
MILFAWRTACSTEFGREGLEACLKTKALSVNLGRKGGASGYPARG